MSVNLIPSTAMVPPLLVPGISPTAAPCLPSQAFINLVFVLYFVLPWCVCVCVCRGGGGGGGGARATVLLEQSASRRREGADTSIVTSSELCVEHPFDEQAAVRAANREQLPMSSRKTHRDRRADREGWSPAVVRRRGERECRRCRPTRPTSSRPRARVRRATARANRARPPVSPRGRQRCAHRRPATDSTATISVGATFTSSALSPGSWAKRAIVEPSIITAATATREASRERWPRRVVDARGFSGCDCAHSAASSRTGTPCCRPCRSCRRCRRPDRG